MKRTHLLFTLIAGLGAIPSQVHAQAPAPAVAIPSGGAIEKLRAIREQNARLLERQTATLKKLDELEQTSQTLKVLGRRS